MKIISEKDLRVTNNHGTAVIFYAGVPKNIADEIGILAIQMGAKEYNAKFVEEEAAEEAVFEEVTEAVCAAPIADTQLDVVLVTCLERIMDEGDPKNFKANGYPKAAVVNKVMGRTIDTDTREAAWESILNS